MKRLSALFALAISLSACAREAGDYPSLATRPAERQGFDEPAAPVAEPVRADPALDARIAAAVRALAERRSRFDAAARTAETRIGAASRSPAGSDAWISAQTALADLDVLRAETAEALSPLEDAQAERAGALEPAYPALDTAVKDGEALSADQATRIDTLQARLAPAR